MDPNLNLDRRIEFIKSDVSCDDFNGGTLIDVERIACACINNGSKVEGCNLLVSYGRILESRGGKRADNVKDFLMKLDAAKNELT